MTPGVAWWKQRARRNYVTQVQTGWVRAGQIVQVSPVGATCLGNQPRRLYSGGVFGALGITDGRLVFAGYRRHTANISVPSDQIRHIGFTMVHIWPESVYMSRRALAVHYEGPDGWRVGTFLIADPVEFAQALGEECGLPVYDAGSAREDYGPARAARLTQDIYGEWREDRSGDLYLAPDRLLFDGRDAILLKDIRRLDAHSRLNPFASALLRVEYEGPDGEVESAGFELRGAAQWADAIRRRTVTPLEVYTGRKRKQEE